MGLKEALSRLRGSATVMEISTEPVIDGVENLTSLEARLPNGGRRIGQRRDHHAADRTTRHDASRQKKFLGRTTVPLSDEDTP